MMIAASTLTWVATPMIVKGVATMKDLIKVIVWFLVINFSICNQIWTEPVSYWWVIEIVVLIISILMVDKSAKK
jgi:hypothetical protein